MTRATLKWLPLAMMMVCIRLALAGDGKPVVPIDETLPTELLESIEEAFNQPDRREQLTDLLIQAEEFSEQRPVVRGVALEALASAGGTDVAKDELVGIVVDIHGKPISGAKVDAWSWFPGHETATDEKGLFRLKVDHHEKTQVVVSKEGYAPRMYLQRPAGAKDWIVVLRNAACLEGTVRGMNNQPVPGATIRATCGPFKMDGGVLTEFSQETTSGKDGTYRLYLFPQVYDVQASAPGRGVMRKLQIPVAPNQSTEMPVVLERGVRFKVQVVDHQSKQPVEGFRLFKWQPPRISGRSDKLGEIVFDDLISGQIQFQCGGGERLPLKFDFDVFGHGPFGRWWSPEAIHEHQRYQLDDPIRNWQRNFDDLSFELSLDMKPVTIFIEQGVTITGRVTDPDGKPVAKATVAPARTGTGNSLTGDTRYSVRTDEDGHYKMVLPASNDALYNLVAHDGDYNQWRNWANGVGEPIQTTPGLVIENYDLQLTRPAVIRGRVTANGKPVSDRQVRTHDFGKQENRYYDPTVRTAEDGTFELKFVRPGKHYLQAHPFWLDAEDAKKGSIVVEVESGDVLEDIELQVD